MSPADSTDSPRGVYVQKAKADIYTVLLAIALVAILIACLLLFLEVRAYNYDIRAQEGRFRAAIETPIEGTDPLPVGLASRGAFRPGVDC